MLVSVYIPTKNRLSLLKRAIESVMIQSFQNWELLVVNDASTDETRNYLDALRERDSRVVVFHNEMSVGGSAARNIAIKGARGEFCTGLDDDDYFLPQRLEDLIQLWTQSEHQKPACVFSSIIAECSGVKARPNNPPVSISSDEFFRSNAIGSQVFAPTSYYVGAGLFDEHMPAWQDYEFFMRILRKYGTAYSTPVPSYVYDTSPRRDRISKQSEEKLRFACERMCSLYASGNPVHEQLLRAQVYSAFYGLRPSFAELLQFAALRPSLWSLQTATRTIARNLAHDIRAIVQRERTSG